jgi:hypothetical protein
LRRARRLLALAPILAALACGAANGTPLRPELPKATETGEAFGGAQCSALRPPTEPDLMAWDPGSRAELAMLRTQGVVAVRYRAEGCNVELEVLSNCIGAGRYGYLPYAASDTKIARNGQELYAALPVGAARLGASLQGWRALRTDYTLVGVAALPPGTAYDVSSLHGPGCERATHVVSRIYLGGFAMVAGEARAIEAEARVFGAGISGAERASAEHVAREGVAEACADAQAAGTENARCAVPLRLGLLPIAGRTEGGCPSGTRLVGGQCVRRELVTELSCPPGTSLADGKCFANVSRTCPSGLHFEANEGCVPDVHAAPPPPPAPMPTRMPGDPRRLAFYLHGDAALGLHFGDTKLRALLESRGPLLRACVLDLHLEDEWSMFVRVTFGERGTRSVATRVLHRGVDAKRTPLGDALFDCAGLTATWPWPAADAAALQPGEKPYVQIEAGVAIK